MRKLSILIIALASAAAGMVPVTGAGAGDGPAVYHLDVELLSATEPLRLGLTIDPSEGICEEGTFEVLTVEVYDYDTDALVATVAPLSVTDDPTDPNSAEMVLPSDTPGGVIYVAATCDDGIDAGVEATPAAAVDVDGYVMVATLGINKVVDGAAPDDAAFTVRVDCSDVGGDSVGPAAAWTTPTVQDVGDTFVVDLAFTVAGGTKYVYMDDGGLCLITEPVTGGADSVTVSNDIDTTPAPAPYTSTVTNTFAAAVDPNFTG